MLVAAAIMYEEYCASTTSVYSTDFRNTRRRVDVLFVPHLPSADAFRAEEKPILAPHSIPRVVGSPPLK
jgi:hypothetical protein